MGRADVHEAVVVANGSASVRAGWREGAAVEVEVEEVVAEGRWTRVELRARVVAAEVPVFEVEALDVRKGRRGGGGGGSFKG